jgi:protein-S-isoprenylcysteine O-methyltransferase Ste14
MKLRTWFFKWRGALMVPLAIIILILGKPIPLSFTIGIVIALLGELLRIWGVGYAGKTTRALEIKAPFLVTAGPYAYVRNPLYIGNALTGLGFVIMACGGIPWTTRAILASLYLIFYVVVYGTIIPQEEDYLKTTFGDIYTQYCSNVGRVLPRLAPYKDRQGTFSWAPVFKGETETLIMFTLFSAIMAFKLFFPGTLSPWS